jgi:hemolysin III
MMDSSMVTDAAGVTVAGVDREPSRPRPRLRGVSHQFAAMAALVAGVVLVVLARGGPAATASAVYAGAMTALFTISAAYHRPTWSPAARQRMRRLDHATIFLMIAGSATPFCALGLAPATAARALTVMWLGAATGILKTVFWPNAPRALNAAVYVALGCILLPHLGALGRTLGPTGLALLLGGGLLYAAGAVVYALRRPDPLPRVFGYHEVFHAMVIAAAVCHFIAVFQAVRHAGA